MHMKSMHAHERHVCDFVVKPLCPGVHVYSMCCRHFVDCAGEDPPEKGNSKNPIPVIEVYASGDEEEENEDEAESFEKDGNGDWLDGPTQVLNHWLQQYGCPPGAMGAVHPEDAPEIQYQSAPVNLRGKRISRKRAHCQARPLMSVLLLA